MLAQDASAQALEKSVILDFNSRLAAKISQFQANNTGVRAPYFHFFLSGLISSYLLGDNIFVGRQCTIHHYAQLSHHVRLPGRHLLRILADHVLGVSIFCHTLVLHGSGLIWNITEITTIPAVSALLYLSVQCV